MPRPAVLLAAILVLTLAAVLVARPGLASDPHGNDFTAYWAAGRVLWNGDSPYRATNLLEVQKTIGWEPDSPLMIWMPPWIMPVLMAFGSIDFGLSRAIWLILQLALTLGCVIALWRFHRGPPESEWVVIVLTLLFVPLMMSLKYGQIGPLCLFGLTAFLFLQAQRRDFLAGLVLIFPVMKPHLVYMLWPALLVWSISNRRWRILIGLTAAVVGFAIIPVIVNSNVYADFLAMVSRFGEKPKEEGRLFITNQDSPTFGWQLRLFFGMEHFNLQYVPTAVGMLWLAWYGYRHRREWDWAERLPVLLLASICTAAYGAWVADSVLLLPAIIAVAARLAIRNERTSVLLAATIFVVLTFLTLLIERLPTTQLYVWIPPIYLVTYCYFTRTSSVNTKPSSS